MSAFWSSKSWLSGVNYTVRSAASSYTRFNFHRLSGVIDTAGSCLSGVKTPANLSFLWPFHNREYCWVITQPRFRHIERRLSRRMRHRLRTYLRVWISSLGDVWWKNPEFDISWVYSFKVVCRNRLILSFFCVADWPTTAAYAASPLVWKFVGKCSNTCS